MFTPCGLDGTPFGAKNQVKCSRIVDASGMKAVTEVIQP
jgi:hypothetical protein